MLQADIGAGRRLAVEVVGVEGEVPQGRQALSQTGDDRLALEGILADGQVGRQQLVLFASIAHGPIVPEGGGSAPFWVVTESFSMENAMEASPTSSLQSTCAPTAVRASSTSGAGCP